MNEEKSLLIFEQNLRNAVALFQKEKRGPQRPAPKAVNKTQADNLLNLVRKAGKM